MNYWVMLHFHEALLIYKIEFWCELLCLKKIFRQKIIVVLKLSAFCFEVSSFSSPGFFSVSYCIDCSWYVWHPKHGSVLLYRCASVIFKRQGGKLVSRISYKYCKIPQKTQIHPIYSILFLA